MEPDLQREIEKETAENKKLLQQITKELRKMPKGKLEVCVANGKYAKHYAVTTEAGKTVRRYIPKQERKLAEQLAQKAFETRLKKVLVKRVKILEKTSHALAETSPLGVYARQSEERKKLIFPLVTTDEQYIEQWYEEHRGEQNSFPMSASYTTIRGETVRSKSEKMIADAYHLAGIPYVYEPAILLRNGRKRHPDFAVLNVRLRKTIYHEHFGLMDDDDYRRSAILKMREYNRNGFAADMMYTFEGEGIPFDQEELEFLIESVLR